MASRRLGFAALVPLLLMFMALVVSFACAFGFGGLGRQQSHHLHLYMHDFAAGPNASTIRVAHDSRPLLGGSKLWRSGDMVVMDDALTEGPGMGSRAVGRAQGFYIAASSKGSDPKLHMSFHLLLTCGPYNGSTLAVTGRDNVLAPVRELSVVGGVGRFRMATGYVLMETVEWWHGQYALLELNVYVHA